MKALLVAMNAKYIHSNLGVYSIRAYGMHHGLNSQQFDIAEYTINQELSDIMADIYQKKPTFLAFSCYIWNIREILILAGELHKIMPEIPIWLGGPEVSYHAEELLSEHPYLFGVMVGEGEQTFLEVVKTYQEYDNSPFFQEKLEQVQSIVFATEEEIITTPKRPVLSMDELIFPYSQMEQLENRIVYYETSRGCPFGCSYCLSSVDRCVRLRSMELVRKELQFFLDHKVPLVKFVDRTFNVNREHTMAIWQYIYEHDNGITSFHFEISADLLREEELAFVRNFRPGLIQFEIGVQTTNPDTMKAICRTSDLQQLAKRVAGVYEHRNIHQHLDLIAGLPYEDYASFRNSYNDVHGMKPDQLQLGFLKVLKGSPMAENQQKYGVVCQDIPPYEVLYTKWLSYADVLRLKQVEAMTELYYNSMQFEASRRYMEGLFETPFDFYQQLGAYYQKREQIGIHHSRIQTYEILLEFLESLQAVDVSKKGQISCSANDCSTQILRECMTFDLYARENMKSRPQFSEDQSQKEWKQFVRDFFCEATMRTKYLNHYEGYEWKQMMRMTHIERFHYDMLTLQKTGRMIKKTQILLFDYEKRDALSHQATITEIEEY